MNLNVLAADPGERDALTWWDSSCGKTHAVKAKSYHSDFKPLLPRHTVREMKKDRLFPVFGRLRGKDSSDYEEHRRWVRGVLAVFGRWWGIRSSTSRLKAKFEDEGRRRRFDARFGNLVCGWSTTHTRACHRRRRDKARKSQRTFMAKKTARLKRRLERWGCEERG